MSVLDYHAMLHSGQQVQQSHTSIHDARPFLVSAVAVGMSFSDVVSEEMSLLYSAKVLMSTCTAVIRVRPR